jgi:hypothetical protein
MMLLLGNIDGRTYQIKNDHASLDSLKEYQGRLEAIDCPAFEIFPGQGVAAGVLAGYLSGSRPVPA